MVYVYVKLMLFVWVGAGYTVICGALDGTKVSEMLNRLYSRFDELSLHHGVFKVETIGDA